MAQKKKAAKRTRRPTIKIEGVSVVLLGSFNPPIFQPAWMGAQGILDAEEAKAVEIGIIHPDVVAFRTTAIGIDVSRDRFHAETADMTAVEWLRDLVSGTFSRLSHTPVRAMGINKSAHYQMGSQEAWHELGNRLLPKKPWEAILEKPGTRSITAEGVRPDSYRGYLRVQFEPSVRVEPNGIFIAVNDHFELQEDGQDVTAADAMRVLGDVWEAASARAVEAEQHLVSLV